jgi:putative SOS response-associated peptidase YedK
LPPRTGRKKKWGHDAGVSSAAAPFVVTGLWDSGACALMTTQADAVVAPVHDRRPLILPPSDFALWLDPLAALPDLRGLLRPGVEAGLLAVAVGSWVNDARHEGPRCVQPVGEQGQLDLTAG